MQNKTKKYSFFKIISGLVLIQGVLQLLNLLGLVGYGRTTTSATKFYLGLVLIGGYAVAAMVGGYTGLKDGNTQEGCKRCFYVSLVLIAITIATIILNVVFKAYSVTQFEALIIPVLFMLFTILNGRKICKHKRVFFDFERGPFYSCSFLDDMI